MSSFFAEYPVEPGQFHTKGYQLAKNEFSGMLYCPWKKGEIALMRCKEYQTDCGQALVCAFLPKQSDLDQAERSMRDTDSPRPFEDKRSYMANVRARRPFGMCKCGAVAVYKSTKECNKCYSRRMYGHRPQRKRRVG